MVLCPECGGFAALMHCPAPGCGGSGGFGCCTSQWMVTPASAEGGRSVCSRPQFSSWGRKLLQSGSALRSILCCGVWGLGDCFSKGWCRESTLVGLGVYVHYLCCEFSVLGGE